MAWSDHFIKQRIRSPRQAFNVKIIKGSLAKRECEEFEMCLQHKSKLWVYRKMKREVGFEEYFEHINKVLCGFFLKFRSGTPGLFEELGSYTKRDGVPGMS